MCSRAHRTHTAVYEACAQALKHTPGDATPDEAIFIVIYTGRTQHQGLLLHSCPIHSNPTMPRVLSPFEQQFIFPSLPHSYSKSKGPVIKTDAAAEGKGSRRTGVRSPVHVMKRHKGWMGVFCLSERWALRNKMVKVNAVLTDEFFHDIYTQRGIFSHVTLAIYEQWRML